MLLRAGKRANAGQKIQKTSGSVRISSREAAKRRRANGPERRDVLECAFLPFWPLIRLSSSNYPILPVMRRWYRHILGNGVKSLLEQAPRRAHMSKTIAIIAALDTKGTEALFIAECIERRGHR